MNTFKFIGTIKKIKEKADAKNKAIETKFFESGWTINRARFTVDCGNQRRFVEVSGGKWEKESDNFVYTTFKENKDGEVKYTSAKVEWNKRFNQEVVDQVANFKLYTLDLYSDKIREALRTSGDVATATEYEKYKYTYISSYDFAIKVKEFLEAGKFGDEKYVVTGTIDYTYSINKSGEGSYYKTFNVTSIRRAGVEEEECAVGKYDYYFMPETVLGEEDEDGDLPVYGYLQYYDRASKKNYYVAAPILIAKDNPKKQGFEGLFKMGPDDAAVQLVGLSVSFFEGSEEKDIDLSELNENQSKLLASGLIDDEYLRNEANGGKIVGPRVDKTYLRGLVSGYSSGPKGTDLEPAALYSKPSGQKGSSANKEEKAKKVSALIDDIFDDDDI